MTENEFLAMSIAYTTLIKSREYKSDAIHVFKPFGNHDGLIEMSYDQAENILGDMLNDYFCKMEV